MPIALAVLNRLRGGVARRVGEICCSCRMAGATQEDGRRAGTQKCGTCRDLFHTN